MKIEIVIILSGLLLTKKTQLENYSKFIKEKMINKQQIFRGNRGNMIEIPGQIS